MERLIKIESGCVLNIVCLFWFFYVSQPVWKHSGFGRKRTWKVLNKRKKSPFYAPAYRALIVQAEEEVRKGSYSVVYKKGIAPSGDKHDYVSLSRYWWRNPSTSNGLPYVFKDGESNPELNHYDRNTLGNMCNAVSTLSLAFFYSGSEKYAEKAFDLLKIWFLNSDTKMNPNLEYSQFIPGRDDSKGRPEGLIDSYSFVGMLNSIPLLRTSAHYSEADEVELKKNGLATLCIGCK